METQNRKLLERLVELMPIVGKDKHSPNIRGVCIEQSQDRRELILTVTDSYRAIRETFQHETLPELLGENKYLISPDSLPTLKVALKSLGKYGEPELKADLHNGKHKTLQFNGHGIVITETNSYPNVEAVTPVLKSTDNIVSFDSKLLVELAKALGDKKSHKVKLQYGDKNSPITVTCGNRKAVLMPCRI